MNMTSIHTIMLLTPRQWVYNYKKRLHLMGNDLQRKKYHMYKSPHIQLEISGKDVEEALQ